jgi:hypothetical protein
MPIFIESIYFKRFGKEKPDTVRSIKEIVAAQRAKKQAKKLARLARKAERMATGADGTLEKRNATAEHASGRPQEYLDFDDIADALEYPRSTIIQ